MTEILTLGYSNEFALSDDFDLNSLRKLHAVREVGGKYVPDEGNGIELRFGKKVVFEEKEAEGLELDEAKKSSEQYRKWWNEERNEKKKLQEELKRLKTQMEQMQTPPEDNPSEDTP